MSLHSRAPIRLTQTLLCGLLLLSGCRSFNFGPYDCAFVGNIHGLTPAARRLAARPVVVQPAPQPWLVACQADFAAGEKLDEEGNPACVDHYYRAAILSARLLQLGIAPNHPDQVAALHVYQHSLAGLIHAGEHYGRLDPRRQLVLSGGAVVPIQYHGFAWRSEDFSRVALASDFQENTITHQHATPGIGVALVALRISEVDETFFRRQQPFAVTAVLRPLGSGDSETITNESVLEFYNPLSTTTIAWRPGMAPLERDLTAPLAAVVQANPRQYFRAFTSPTDTTVKPQLILVEPYQRGKIPVIFIHGLYSDPITWVDTVNDLRSQSDLYERYQFWTFRYPTGGELLDSAAVLRDRLLEVRQTYDPEHCDPAMDNVLLVGHSLGGLLSKSQIVWSYDILWREVADAPFSALKAPPEIQYRLSRSFFFEPSPMVSRVIFVGTPHQGSGYARRLPGILSSRLVSFGAEETEQYRELMDANCDVFKPIVTRRRPTTVDMLTPTSPVLTALAQMPINPRVKLHSVIGTGGHPQSGEPSDGVVAVSSARHDGVQSQVYVDSKHERLHRHPNAVTEIARIMRQHAAEVDTGREVVAKRAPARPAAAPAQAY